MRRALRLAVMVSAGMCFGVGFGLNAAKSNQLVYLLGAQRLLHPELWSRDFVVASRNYHPLFAELGALLLRLDGTGWMLGLSNVAAACFGVWVVYRLLRHFLEPSDAFVGLLLVLSLAAASNTDAIGGSYVFDVFQPSTLGSVGLLAASLAFVGDRPLVAGMSLAFAGAFHINYLLLGLCVFGVAWLFGGQRGWLRRGLLLLGPSLPVLAYFVPMLLAASSGGHAAVEEARRIYQDVRSPHHYHIAGFARDFLPWAGFQLLGTAALWKDAVEAPSASRRLLVLLASFAVLIASAALLSSVLSLRAVDQLFAWRVSPHANLLAQSGLAAFVVPAVRSAQFRLDRLQPVQRWCGLIGCGSLVLGAVLGASTMAAVFGAAFALLPLVVGRLAAFSSLSTERRQVWLCALCGVAFVVGDFGNLRHVRRNSDLLSGRDGDVGALCSWLERATPTDALLLIPPDEEELRYRCRRAVVVDWKAVPALPGEVLEWKRRLEDIIGGPLRREADLAGYRELDGTRLDWLRVRYGFDAVVVKSDAILSLGVAPDFAFGRFRVYRLR